MSANFVTEHKSTLRPELEQGLRTQDSGQLYHIYLYHRVNQPVANKNPTHSLVNFLTQKANIREKFLEKASRQDAKVQRPQRKEERIEVSSLSVVQQFFIPALRSLLLGALCVMIIEKLFDT